MDGDIAMPSFLFIFVYVITINTLTSTVAIWVQL